MGHREFQCRILDAIARDFSREHNFPTCLDAAHLIRNTLRDPAADIATVRSVVGREPLIAARIIRLANTVAYNPGGLAIVDLSAAIGRVGFEAVRTLSLAVVLQQMSQAAMPPQFQPYARQAWERSIEVSAIAHALARRYLVCNPEEALLAALLSRIGVFYLLFRARDESACQQDPAFLLLLLRERHADVRDTILPGLDVPLPIRLALSASDSLPAAISADFVPDSLPGLLRAADRLSSLPCAWEDDDSPASRASRAADRQRLAPLIADAGDAIGEIRQALAG